MFDLNLISVIICTHNRCESLRDALESLLGQRGNGNFQYEVIVVDNNSVDMTKEVVMSFKKRFEERLRYLFEPRQGKPYALNKGIKVAKGDIIAFTDDDVAVDKRWLKTINQTFAKYNCMAMGGRVLPIRSFKPPPWIQVRGLYRILAAVTSFDRGKQIKHLKYGDYPPIGANFAFRNIAFKKYGLFDTNLGYRGGGLIGGEDNEFSNRLLKNSESFMYIPDAVVYHSVDERKFKKSFCRKWYFSLGRGSQRREEYPQDGIRYFNIPRYLFKQLSQNISKWMLALLTFRKTNIVFYYELHVLYVLGKIYANFFEKKQLKDRACYANSKCNNSGL